MIIARRFEGGNRKPSPAFPDFSFLRRKPRSPQKYTRGYNYMEIIFWSLSREKFFALRWRKEKTMQLLLSEDLLLGFGVFTQFSSLPPPSHNSCNRRKTKQEKETLMSRKLPLFILFDCAMPAFEFSPEKRADRIQNSFSKRSTPDYPQKIPARP